MGKPGEIIFTHSKTGQPYPYPEMTRKILALNFCETSMVNNWKLYSKGLFTVWIKGGGVWKLEKSKGALTERNLAHGRGFDALKTALVKFKVLEGLEGAQTEDEIVRYVQKHAHHHKDAPLYASYSVRHPTEFSSRVVFRDDTRDLVLQLLKFYGIPEEAKKRRGNRA